MIAKLMTLLAPVFIFSIGTGSVAQARCELSILRTGCPGKEAETIKPYSGLNPTQEITKARDAAACLKDADKASIIIRKGVVAKVVVDVNFDGKPLGKKETVESCSAAK